MSIIREMKEEETPVYWISRIVFDAVGFEETQLHKELRMSFDLALRFEKDHLMDAFDEARKSPSIKNGEEYYTNKFKEIV